MRVTKAGISKIGKALGKLFLTGLNALLVVGGTALIGYGAWLIYRPSAFIVVGLVCVYLGLPDKSEPKA